jgi:hypothetical protein
MTNRLTSRLAKLEAAIKPSGAVRWVIVRVTRTPLFAERLAKAEADARPTMGPHDKALHRPDDLPNTS